MSDFPSVVKHLDIVPSRKATNVDLLGTQPNMVDPLKYQKLTGASRAIKKIPTTLTLPAFSYPAGTTVAYNGRLLFQYNISMPEDFYILNVNSAATTGIGSIVNNGVLTVKYRVGNTVYRYNIQGEDGFAPKTNFKVNFPRYNNQLIKKNCCFEFWYNILNLPFPFPYGLKQDLTFDISYLDDPIDSNQLKNTLNTTLPYFIIDTTNLATVQPIIVGFPANNIWTRVLGFVVGQTYRYIPGNTTSISSGFVLDGNNTYQPTGDIIYPGTYSFVATADPYYLISPDPFFFNNIDSDIFRIKSGIINDSDLRNFSFFLPVQWPFDDSNIVWLDN